MNKEILKSKSENIGIFENLRSQLLAKITPILAFVSLSACTQVSYETYTTDNPEDYIGSNICVGSERAGISYEITDFYNHLRYRDETLGGINQVKCVLVRGRLYVVPYETCAISDVACLEEGTYSEDKRRDDLAVELDSNLGETVTIKFHAPFN